MAKKFFSLIIVPHSKARFKRITLSEKAIKALLGGSAFLLVALVIFLVDYFTMNITRQKYKELYNENVRQKEAIAGYKDSLEQIYKVIGNLENYAKKLNIMAGLNEGGNLDEAGIGAGSSSPGEEMSSSDIPQEISITDIKNISQKAEDLERNLTTLVNFFESQSARLACTPSIFPTTGWVTSGFGWRKDPFTGKIAFHRGIDIATNFGNTVVSTADGIIVQLRNDKIGGKTILVSHGGGLTSLYCHLDKFLVKPGQKVNRGDVIGLVGKTGKALGPHVHYEIRINERSVNPYNYILEE